MINKLILKHIGFSGIIINHLKHNENSFEFKIDENDMIIQTATFRPRGVFGRLYWYTMLPFHGFIFKNMLKKIADV